MLNSESPSRFETLCEGVIEAGWLAALATVPLFFNPYSRQSFEPDKTVLLRLIVLTMVAAWLIKIAGGGRAGIPVGEPGTMRLWRVPLVLPSLLVVVSTVVSAAVSEDPWISFSGSYARAQGVWMLLACAALFALVLAHLRTAPQWRRILYMVTLTSFAVASYAVLQRLRLDPVRWDFRESRVGSTLGNPIFLAAFLGLVLFLTAREVTSRVARAVRPGAQAPERSADLPTVVILLYNLFLQVLAISLAQSRGPLLGTLTGTFLGTLAFLLHARARASSAEPMRWRGVQRWAWLILIGLSVGTLTTLWVASRPGSPLIWMRTVPYVGRLAAPFELTGTAQTRLLTWEGGLGVVQDGSNLSEDSTLGPAAHRLLGYGPEMFRFAFARHHPVLLAHYENPTSVPDRAHNEVLDRLVNTGLIGLVGWFCWYGAVFALGVTGTFPSGRSRRVLYWTVVTGAAIAGAGLPVLLGAPRLAFFGLPTGMLAGIALSLGLLSRGGGDRGATATVWTPRQSLIAALLATVAAHVVETNLGIEVTTTKLYIWFFAALLVVAHRGWLDLETSNERSRPEPPGGTAVIGGLMAALLVATIAFSLLGGDGSSTSALGVLAGNVSSRHEATPVGGALWLPVVVWVVAAGAAASLESGKRSERSSGAWVFAATSLGTSAAYMLVHAHRLARTAELHAARRPLLEIQEHIAGHAAAYLCFVPLWMLGAGAVLGWRRGTSVAFCRQPRSAAVAAAIVGAVTIGLMATTMRPLAAETLVKQGIALQGAGRLDEALEALRRGTSLAPRQPTFELLLGAALVDAAQAAPRGPERDALFAEARTRLDHARQLSPLDPDHTANLGRLSAIEAELAPDLETRQSSFALAAAEFEHGLALRPNWIGLLAEYAVVEHRRGERERAFRMLNETLALDPIDVRVHRALAYLHAAEAVLANAVGDSEAERDHLEAAAIAQERANQTVRPGQRPPLDDPASAPAASEIQDGSETQE